MTPTLSVPVLAWLPPLIMMLAGLALALRGWRGRLVSDHPVCRRCGFDLFNRPADSTVCPECGSSLASPRAVRHGQRQKRTGLLTAGSLLLFCGVAWLGVGSFVSLRGIDLNPYKPNWWLIREAFGSDAARRDAALATLADRVEKKQVSDGDIARLTDRALALQADRSKPWVPKLGDVFLSAATAGKVSDDRIKRFAEQAFTQGVEVRARVSRDDKVLPYWTTRGATRAGTRNDGRATVKFGPPQIDSLPPMEEHALGDQHMDLVGSGRYLGSSIALTNAPELRDGRHVVRFPARVSVSLSPTLPASDPKDVMIEVPWELLPAGRKSVTLVRNDKLHPAVQKAISINDALTVRSDYVQVTVMTNPPPVAIGFDVFVRAGGAERKLGAFARPAGGSPHGFGVGVSVDRFTAERVDVILRPSAAAAAATVDTYEVWDGEEIVIPDVNVEKRD